MKMQAAGPEKLDTFLGASRLAGSFGGCLVVFWGVVLIDTSLCKNDFWGVDLSSSRVSEWLSFSCAESYGLPSTVSLVLCLAYSSASQGLMMLLFLWAALAMRLRRFR